MPDRPAFARWLGETNDITTTFLAAGRIPGMINIAGGLPEPTTYPLAEIAELTKRALEETSLDSLNYSPIPGIPELRDAIAARFSTSGLELSRDNVLITSGGMQALDLVGKVLLEQSELIAAQTPAYLGALDAWRPRYPRYRRVALDDKKTDAELALKDAKFLYAVPNFSNPSGKLVNVERRSAFVEAALHTGTWVLEDDPYGSLYFDHEPLPRMLTLAGEAKPGAYDGPVIYTGTLSKELAPGFRVGWVIAAPDMIDALIMAKQGTDMSTGGLNQCVAKLAIETGLLEKARPKILETYGARRDALLHAMEKHLTDYFSWEKPVGGMFIWATARNPTLNTDTLMKIGLEHGVCISPSSAFDPCHEDHRSMRLNFTANPPEMLEEGIKRLAKATSRLLDQSKSKPRSMASV